ncbi:MAG: glycosyltransferase family 4 protein [Arenibacterium sp.]
MKGAQRIRNLRGRVRGALLRDPLAAGRKEQNELLALAQSHPPTVIYAHTGFVGLRLLPLAQALNVPIVVHFHGLDVTETNPVYQREIARNLQKFDHVIVVGNWMTKWFTDKGYARKDISVIPMGAPVKDRDTTTQRANDSVCRFVAVGRLVGVKGLDRTLKAFSILKQENKDVALSIIGSGPLEHPLRQQASQLGLTPDDIFRGSMPSDEVMDYLATQCDVLVQHAVDKPGGPEAFGVTITEAMAQGLPVVSTLCGGIPDQILDGETGFLVAQDDVAAMADKMALLARDPALRQRLGSQGRARALHHFDSADLARKCENLLVEFSGPNAGSAL